MNKKPIILIVVLTVFLTLLVLISLGKCCFHDHCEIPFQNDDSAILPLFINSKTNDFVYSADKESLIFQREDSITIGCPGSKLNIGLEVTEIQCITDTSFFLSDDDFDVTSAYCLEEINSIGRYAKNTGEKCENNGKEIEIGFQFNNGNFFKMLRVCFDPIQQTPLYTEHLLTNLISNKQISNSGRPFFRENDFYHLNGRELFDLYGKSTQRATINRQLNLPPNSNKIIKDGNLLYLSRGHLAPKADFFYASQQNATFYYVNTAPQWNVINSNSWNTLEWRIRSYASKQTANLRIFTGSYGVLMLPNYSSNFLYLYNEASSKAIPIPEIFWKVVYNPVSRLGVAFVGTNNPFLEKDNLSNYCENILSKLQWIRFKNDNFTNGIISACDINDLRDTVPYIPKLDLKGVLYD